MKKKDKKYTEVFEHRGKLQGVANIFRLEMKIVKEVNRKNQLA